MAALAVVECELVILTSHTRSLRMAVQKRRWLGILRAQRRKWGTLGASFKGRFLRLQGFNGCYLAAYTNVDLNHVPEDRHAMHLNAKVAVDMPM
jgi:hypothetical protein